MATLAVLATLGSAIGAWAAPARTQAGFQIYTLKTGDAAIAPRAGWTCTMYPAGLMNAPHLTCANPGSRPGFLVFMAGRKLLVVKCVTMSCSHSKTLLDTRK
jgi:hypothetical protein